MKSTIFFVINSFREQLSGDLVGHGRRAEDQGQIIMGQYKFLPENVLYVSVGLGAMALSLFDVCAEMFVEDNFCLIIELVLILW